MAQNINVKTAFYNLHAASNFKLCIIGIVNYQVLGITQVLANGRWDLGLDPLHQRF